MDWTNPAVYIGILAIIGAIFSIGKWVGGMNSFKKSMDAFSKRVDSAISEMRDDIKKILERLPPSPPVASMGSPLRLTEFGQSISETIEAGVWAQKTAEDTVHRVKGKRPYEIQEFCQTFVKEEFQPSEDLLQKMQDCAYDNATSLDQVKEVLALELRDALLKIS